MRDLNLFRKNNFGGEKKMKQKAKENNVIQKMHVCPFHLDKTKYKQTLKVC